MTLCKKITERLEKRENNYTDEIFNGDISTPKLIWKAFSQGMMESFVDSCIVIGVVYYVIYGIGVVLKVLNKEDK